MARYTYSWIFKNHFFFFNYRTYSWIERLKILYILPKLISRQCNPKQSLCIFLCRNWEASKAEVGRGEHPKVRSMANKILCRKNLAVIAPLLRIADFSMTVEPAVFLWNYGWLRNTPFDICFSSFLALLFILFLLPANKLYQNVNKTTKMVLEQLYIHMWRSIPWPLHTINKN